MISPPPLSRRLLAALSLLTIALVLIGTRHGAGISPDGVSYLYGARSVLAGNGLIDTYFAYRQMPDIPFTIFSPLFPILIAGLGALGLDLTTAGRLINAVASGALIFVAGEFYAVFLKSKGVAWLALLATLLSVVLWRNAVVIGSESLYILLTVAFGWYLVRYLQTPTLRLLLAAAACAALSFLDRYIGVIAVITGGLVLILPRVPTLPPLKVAVRVRHWVAYGLTAGLPVLLWLAASYIATRNLGGPRDASNVTAGAVLQSMLEWLTSWFLPSPLPFLIRVMVIITALSGLFGGLFLLRKTIRLVVAWQLIAVPATFSVLYLIFLLAAELRTYLNLPDNRYLSPLFVFALTLLGVALDTAIRAWPSVAHSRNLQRGLIALAALWLLYPALRFGIDYVGYWRSGITPIYAMPFQPQPDSVLTRWLTDHASSALYSDVPEGVFILTNTRVVAHYGPTAQTDLDTFLSQQPVDDKYVIWFGQLTQMRQVSEGTFRSPQDTAFAAHLTLVLDTPAAKIYHLN